MKFSPIAAPNRRAKRSGGMTLPEVMVGISVGIMLLLGIEVIFVNSAFSFADMSNYMIMDRTSRSALDQMTRDIRNSADLTSFATNQLVFAYSGTTNLVYNYDSSTGKLTSWKTGDSKTNSLLTGVTNLVFTMYDNVPLSGGTNATTSVLSKGKGIGVSWKCVQTSSRWRRTTEDMQEAIIVIRNKPVY